MRLRKLAAVSAAAIGITLAAAISFASPASAGDCKTGQNKLFYMDVCPDPYGGTVVTYRGNYNVEGHFKVWNHDNVHEWENSKEQVWHYNDWTVPKLAWWPYTCAQFEAYQGDYTWAPYGPIGCVQL